ncbi:N utilization substance protein B [Candidatus Legionella polyplacis]|uniref:transcription antitermination factor NusB n=1 Tax=Candidatus Legionella polyplacis TaxID=2005262 RepID=UPI000C1E8B28|nr:N utilization substance protein B [Candidatus Legionella polyplacis]
MKKIIFFKRRQSRRLVLQALYQWLMSKYYIKDIELQFRTFYDSEKIDILYFRYLLFGIVSSLKIIEGYLIMYLDRSIKSLTPIELTTLRIGTFELIYCVNIPYKVILSESILLNKEFGSNEGYRYINGVLNNVAKRVRRFELK